MQKDSRFAGSHRMRRLIVAARAKKAREKTETSEVEVDNAANAA